MRHKVHKMLVNFFMKIAPAKKNLFRKNLGEAFFEAFKKKLNGISLKIFPWGIATSVLLSSICFRLIYLPILYVLAIFID